ncbi:NERD domain-containing protein [Mucilaginibacter sp. RS28]|uniref:NERD domain-containing protein n=1 Tax=Mucilaginibacter straminoryzae TaxID=2932774 RepID=A0A9X1X5P9_9SPHI|nr:nuclease-related domain-containing protein [Mucilaginibacter straminoryzae]MCJ8211627.1 NERD domain-containing protein [Mucilaginibacter straminoryzae]
MCKVYNSVGSLTAVKNRLLAHNIHNFKSVKELIAFQNEFSALRQKIILNHRQVIKKESDDLSREIPKLKNFIDSKKAELEQSLVVEQETFETKINNLKLNHSNSFQRFLSPLKIVGYKLKLQSVIKDYEQKISSALEPLIADYNHKNIRLNYINTRFDDAVNQSGEAELRELTRKKNVVDQINNHIYGAIGEQKVVKELEKLSDEYILINDFTLEFHPAIYRQQNDDYIKSIQIDHILLSTSGIFLIETKNWSQESMGNLNIHSPVHQIKRTNHALYRVINDKIASSRLRIKTHHWGERKIPIRNLIVLIKHKPVEEFQHVKILTLNEMLSFITYFEPCLSISDVQAIANELVSINRSLILM